MDRFPTGNRAARFTNDVNYYLFEVFRFKKINLGRQTLPGRNRRHPPHTHTRRPEAIMRSLNFFSTEHSKDKPTGGGGVSRRSRTHMNACKSVLTPVSFRGEPVLLRLRSLRGRERDQARITSPGGRVNLSVTNTCRFPSPSENGASEMARLSRGGACFYAAFGFGWTCVSSMPLGSLKVTFKCTINMQLGFGSLLPPPLFLF